MAGSAAPSSTGQNETYLGNRLLFQRSGEVEVGLTDVVDGAQAKKILKRAIVGAILIGLAFTALSLMVAVGSLSTASRNGASAGGVMALAFVSIGTIGPWIWILLVLLVPITEVLSDWHLLLDGKAEIADTAYGVVYRSLTVDHHIPASVVPKRVRVGPPVPGVRNLLRIAIGKYYSYVSVYAFGNDLYLGWTLWRRQIPIMVVFRWFSSLFGTDPGYSGMIEMEPIKAMREAVHNALRGAIEAAIVGRSIPLVETFGYDVRIEADNGQYAAPAHAAPRPVAPQPMVTVLRRVEVFSAEDHASLGEVDAGATFQIVHDSPDNGITLRDNNGVIALLKDRSAVRWL